MHFITFIFYTSWRREKKTCYYFVTCSARLTYLRNEALHLLWDRLAKFDHLFNSLLHIEFSILKVNCVFFLSCFTIIIPALRKRALITCPSHLSPHINKRIQAWLHMNCSGSRLDYTINPSFRSQSQCPLSQSHEIITNGTSSLALLIYDGGLAILPTQ